MANIEEVSGVFGGIKVNETGVQNNAGFSEGNTVNVGTNLPTKTGFWNKVKSVLFYDIKVELTPYQQKVENEVNEFLHQEITWAKVKDFLFQDIKF